MPLNCLEIVLMLKTQNNLTISQLVITIRTLSRFGFNQKIIPNFTSSNKDIEFT
jgi:cAMP phosphodiesterase